MGEVRNYDDGESPTGLVEQGDVLGDWDSDDVDIETRDGRVRVRRRRQDRRAARDAMAPLPMGASAQEQQAKLRDMGRRYQDFWSRQYPYRSTSR
jgi:hypothetical protein